MDQTFGKNADLIYNQPLRDEVHIISNEKIIISEDGSGMFS